MKRIMPAMVLSFLFHLAVLKMDTGWFERADTVLPAPKVVTVTMSFRQPVKKDFSKKPIEKKNRIKKEVQPKPDMIPEITPPPDEPKIPENEKNEEQPEKQDKAAEEKSTEETAEKLESLTHGDSLSNMQVLQDAVPLYKTNPPPRYPLAARKRGYQGIVYLMVRVTDGGRVADLWVYESSGYQLLDNAALSAVKNWDFEPGTENGKPQEMWVKVPVRFELRGR